MGRLRWAAGVLASLVFGALLVGCGDDDGGAAEVNDEGTPASVTSTANAITGPVSAARGKSL